MDLATPKQILYLKMLQNEFQNKEIENVNNENLTKKEITKLINSLKIKLNKSKNLPNINFSYYKYLFTDFKENEYTKNDRFTPYTYVKGTQLNLKTNKSLSVICFFKLLVLDYDLSDEYDSKEKLLNFITSLLEKENETFLVYETHNGYHVYCVSNTFVHYNKNTIDFMQKLKCDPFYISFSAKIGFVVRLQKKEEFRNKEFRNKEFRNEKFIERFVKKINNFPIKPDLIDLINVKDNYILKATSTATTKKI